MTLGVAGEHYAWRTAIAARGADTLVTHMQGLALTAILDDRAVCAD